MTPSIDPTQSFATPPQTSSSAQASNDLTSESAFLKLLVSQIQHQDPLNPSDGVQFLTQLTSFSQLEQLIQINQELTPKAATTSTTSGITDQNPTSPVS